MYPVFMAELILTFAGLIIIIVFFIGNREKISGRRVVERTFRYLTLTAFIYAVLGVIKQIAVLKTGLLFKVGLMFFVYHIQDMAYLIYTLMWVIFVDAVLYRSSDGLRRRYGLTFIPFAIMLVILIAAFVMERMQIAYGGDQNFLIGLITGILERVYFLIAFLVGAFCMIQAFRLARCYQKEVKQPVFLRLDVFIIPWIFGFLSSLSYLLSLMLSPAGFFRIPDLSVICAALSLVFTFISIKNRYRYMEQETGFYKEEYMDRIIKFMDRRHVVINSGIALRFSKDRDRMALLLSELKPDRSSVISLSDGVFLIFSDTRNGSAVQLLLKLIKTGACEEDPGAEVECVSLLRNTDESVIHFRDRLLKEFKG